MIGAVEFGDARQLPEAGDRLARKVREKLFDQGVLVRPLGPVIYLMPPFVISEIDLMRMVDLLREAITAGGCS